MVIKRYKFFFENFVGQNTGIWDLSPNLLAGADIFCVESEGTTVFVILYASSSLNRGVRNLNYHKVSNIRRTKSQNLNASRLIL